MHLRTLASLLTLSLLSPCSAARAIKLRQDPNAAPADPTQANAVQTDTTTTTTPPTDQTATQAAGDASDTDLTQQPTIGDTIAQTYTTVIPDVAMCDCGFIDGADPNATVWTSYYHADFKGMDDKTLATSLRPLEYALSRTTSPYQRSFRANQVQTGMDGLGLKCSPLDGEQVPSAALSTVNPDFWFGSYHMKGTVANATGSVAAFYTYWNDTQEADIEYIGTDTMQKLRYTTKPQHYDQNHKPLPETYRAQLFPSPNGESFSDGPHFWSFKWTPDAVKFGMDFYYKETLVAEVPQVPSYILVAHWSDGNPGFSGGPPTQDLSFQVEDIWAMYNSSQAQLPLQCQTVKAPCRINVNTSEATIPPEAADAIHIAQATQNNYTSTIVNVNGQAIDETAHQRAVAAKWRGIVVAICGGLLAILVVACLWNFDNCFDRCWNRMRGIKPQEDAEFEAMIAAAKAKNGSGNARHASQTFRVGTVRRMRDAPSGTGHGLQPPSRGLEMNHLPAPHGSKGSYDTMTNTYGWEPGTPTSDPNESFRSQGFLDEKQAYRQGYGDDKSNDRMDGVQVPQLRYTDSPAAEYRHQGSIDSEAGAYSSPLHQQQHNHGVRFGPQSNQAMGRTSDNRI